jgi:hypothetical protein
VKRDTHRIGRRLAVIGALAILVAACGGQSASPVPVSADPAASTAATSDNPAASPSPTDTPTPSPAIDKLQASIPSDIWSSCEPSVSPQFDSTMQSATCTYPGVDGVTYQVFASTTDLNTAYDSILQGTRAKPSTDLPSACAKGNWSGTWTRDGKPAVAADRLECDIESTGAWIVQIDPKVNVLFQANLASGDGAALYTWWTKNPTVVEPGK